MQLLDDVRDAPADGEHNPKQARTVIYTVHWSALKLDSPEPTLVLFG